MGKGTFGKVFKCADSKHQDFVATKVVRSVPRYIKSAIIEANVCDDIYDKMKSSHMVKSLCVKMFSHFHFRGDFFLLLFV